MVRGKKIYLWSLFQSSLVSHSIVFVRNYVFYFCAFQSLSWEYRYKLLFLASVSQIKCSATQLSRKAEIVDFPVCQHLQLMVASPHKEAWMKGMLRLERGSWNGWPHETEFSWPPQWHYIPCVPRVLCHLGMRGHRVMTACIEKRLQLPPTLCTISENWSCPRNCYLLF